MHTDLMGSACLKTAFNHCNIAKTLQDTIMSNRMLAMIPVREDLESHAVIRITADISYNRTLVILEITPDNSYVTTFDGVNKELFCKIQLRLIVLGNNEKT